MRSRDRLELLRPREAFRLLAIGETKGWELIRSRALSSVRIGRARRVTSESVQAFIKALERGDKG